MDFFHITVSSSTGGLWIKNGTAHSCMSHMVLTFVQYMWIHVSSDLLIQTKMCLFFSFNKLVERLHWSYFFFGSSIKRSFWWTRCVTH